jgi:diguanylate cyclase (GGDEF)-like protein
MGVALAADVWEVRRLSLFALVLALMLVPGSFGLAKLQRDGERRSLDAALSQEAAQQRAAIDAYFARARSIVLLTGNSPAFANVLAEPGTREEVVRQQSRNIGEVTHHLGYLEQLYPTSIGEACFIDADGEEFARAVRGEIARPKDLSTVEEQTAFFAPAFALDFGQVHQTRPYVSPDTKEWVVANTTLIPQADGHKRAIVHFEVTVESFRRAMADSTGKSSELLVLDGRTGKVVIDGALPQRDGAALGVPRDARFAGLARGARSAGVTEVAEHRTAYRQIEPTAGNANDWLVVAVSRAPSPSLLGSFGVGSIGMIALAAVLLAFALLNARAGVLRSEANTDALTGLANRRRFLRRLEQATEAAADKRSPVALLLTDLDHFKELNDALGHQAGDRLLEQVGPRLEAAVPAADVVARLGGDEFAILVPAGPGAQDAIAAAAGVRAALEEPFVLSDLSLHVEASVGIAVFPDHGTDGPTLLRHADIAMYRAKGARSGVEIYAAGGEEHGRDRLVLAGELREAISAGELLLHYQPKADLQTGRVVGVEALVRWQHPERGLLAPDVFIPIAEQTEIIRPLTEYVLTHALAQCEQWRRDGLDLTVAVNVSVSNLLDARFAETVKALLDDSGIAPSRLTLEITESVVMADPVRALDILARLGEIGVGLSLDDFGTGYSSLAYLKRLPVQELKIDRSFVMSMAADGNDAAIVRLAVQLAHNLGLHVVAEGVETADAWDQLTEMGCQHGQGYYLSRPLPAEELTSWLQREAGHPTTPLQPLTSQHQPRGTRAAPPTRS